MPLFLFIVIALLLVPLPAIIILLTDCCGVLKPAIPPITASLTLLLGWSFTTYQNSINFFRAETVKHKDKLISLLEDFFDDYIEKLADRKLTEEELRAFLRDKISNIEFKHSIQQQIYGKKAVLFLSNETFSHLRRISEMINKDYKEQKRVLQELKENSLQEIENNYIKWLK